MAKSSTSVSAPEPLERLLVMQDMIRHGATAKGQLSEYVMSITLSGGVHYQIGNDRFIREPGDVMVVKPGAKQSWQVKEDADGGPGHWHVVYAVFNPTAHLLAWMDLPMSEEGYFLLALARQPTVRHRVTAALRKARVLSAGQMPMRKELILQALGEALIWVRVGLESAQGGKPAMDLRVQRALEFMNKKLHGPVTLVEIAKAAMASRSQLSLVFERQMGVPVMKYLERLRMDRAQQMLRMTTHPIKQVAQAVGYEDPKYFVKRFAGVVGVTPRALRRRDLGAI
jgi:AraC family transcriptional regulator, arabinose operon regulatory protein